MKQEQTKMQRISETKNLFFEKIKKIDKSFARLTQRKRTLRIIKLVMNSEI